VRHLAVQFLSYGHSLPYSNPNQMKISNLFVATIAALGAAATTPSSAAGDPESVEFILQQIHKRKFNDCDKAVRAVFEFASGDDVRVNTSTNDELANTLRVTATYGSRGDAALTDVVFRKVGKQCHATSTDVITHAKGCANWRSAYPMWKTSGATPEYEWMENPGGVRALLHEVGGQCVVSYLRHSVY